MTRDNLQHEVRRYDADLDDERDSPALMWALAIGAPLFLIACIWLAKELLF